MKVMTIAIMLAGLALLCGNVGNVYAGHNETTFGMSFSTGDRDDQHHGYYRHYRYFPHEYYESRRVYFLPERRYYYYYDVYPDKVSYYESEKTVIPNNPQYIPLTSIANMASQGVPDSVFIEEIQRTHSVYHLTSQIISYLKQSGVNDKVINAMLNTAR